METSKCTFTFCTLFVYHSCFVETFDFKNISRQTCFTFGISDSVKRSTVNKNKDDGGTKNRKKETILLPLFEQESFYN